ncbi:MAG: hypothetical protein A2664_01600 [Candidatus Taylorbacteria bacterium RIFCSPHIGHO2_01_FULL_46_22b]|uniref:SD-repeat containing protein B domain-containing protein n=1 Tax=Candidatus Taylorbacteria bacterium RIFCSPHIGHO2_01_FULL_46_22b TaxID=1802301 RepID=A0A1G2M2M3_9BACT|nr:MAG: hypothetical protein A2664_01600 [Candidatus Taylorbacteria bacterium RIFCSPHIGHO2_01_FULL_46_22b]
MKKRIIKFLTVSSFAFSAVAFSFLGLATPIDARAAGPALVDLLSAGNFSILSSAGITNTGSHTSVITGNIGSSPISASAMDNVFCSEITGTIFGVDAAYVGSGSVTCFAGNPPLSNKTLVDTAVLDMGTAYTDAAGRTTPTATELGAGNIGGMTLAPGLYKWSTDVTIPTDVTLSGSADDVWIFQIAGDLTIASGGSIPAGIKVVLAGGAQSSNIFWQVGGVTGATLGTYATFNGNILSAKQVIIQTGAVLNGRALAQTQVTLDANTISSPPLPDVKVTIAKYIDGVPALASTTNSASFPMSATWNATNIGAGTGGFAIGPVGFNSPNPYEAVTADMTSGASYSTNEIVDGITVGTACASGTPYTLIGYSTGDTLLAASLAVATTTIPNFTNITSDKYVIVQNHVCPPPVAPTFAKVHILKYLDGAVATASSSNSYLFPMTATWSALNLSGGATSTGSYVLGTNFGGAIDLYGADTTDMQTPAYYATSEVTDDTSSVLPIDAVCSTGKYRLNGYQMSTTSFAHALKQATTTDAILPNITSDSYVLVLNESCPTPEVPVATGGIVFTKYSVGDNGTFSFTGTGGIGAFTLTTATGSSSQAFSNLVPGTYQITEGTLPIDWTQTTTTCSSITVTSNATSTCSITNTKSVPTPVLGEISGIKFEDWDADGSPFEKKWEDPLSGWTIYLDTNNNSVLDLGELSTTTNKKGAYSFKNLPAGTYSVREVNKTGWITITPVSGVHTITLLAGEVVKNKNFGNFKLGSISGMKYNDKNANGKKGGNEAGLAGWTIVLKKIGGATATTTTNASGNYTFSNLGPGTYKLSEVMQTGWTQTEKPNPVRIYSETSSTHENFGNTQKTIVPRGNGYGKDKDNDRDY